MLYDSYGPGSRSCEPSHSVPAVPAPTSLAIATPGNYIIGIKYDPKSIVGNPVPTPANIVYTFTTSLGASTTAQVGMGPK